MDPFVLGKLCKKHQQERNVPEKKLQEILAFLKEPSNGIVLRVIHAPSKELQYNTLSGFGCSAFKNAQLRFIVGYLGDRDSLPSTKRDDTWKVAHELLKVRSYSERLLKLTE